MNIGSCGSEMQSYLQIRAFNHQGRANYAENYNISLQQTNVDSRSGPPGLFDVERAATQRTHRDITKDLTHSSPAPAIPRNELLDSNIINEGPIVVHFEGPDDPCNPRSWSLTRRVLYTANVGIIALVIGAAGAIDSAVLTKAAKEFGVGENVEALATGLVRIPLPSGNP